MNLRTPLGKVRGLGSAKDGSHHWWMQRLTAIVLAPLSLWFIASLVCVSSSDYVAAINWISNPLSAVLLIIFLSALYYHASLGVQVVIEDYIDSEWQKIGCLILVKFLALFAGLISIFAVLKISLGI